LRHAVGLRNLSSGSAAPVAKEAKTALPSFKQYRESNGQFYFKMVDAKGQILLQSLGFASPKEAGQAIARLQTEGAQALKALEPSLETLTTSARQSAVSNLQLLQEARQGEEN
jgi:tryptophanyl-tRNA synthetase